MAECTQTGITFSLWKSPHMEFLWEIGVGAEPLTAELADLRGYGLHNGTESIILDVPLFSIGYTYDVGGFVAHGVAGAESNSGSCREMIHWNKPDRTASDTFQVAKSTMFN